MWLARINETNPLRRPRASVRFLALGLAMSLSALPTMLTAGPIMPPLQVPQTNQSLAPLQASGDTISLLAGLIGIERDLLLGQLFLQDGLVSAEGSHFTHPRRDNFPSIKAGLAKAGAPDLEPLLVALEEAKDKDAVNSAYNGVHGGLLQAKLALQPTEQDVLNAVIQTAEAATALLDPSGTTEVIAYQEAWGLLMVARGQLDQITRSGDPAVKQSATKMALAFDDVILFAPDPGASAPVPFDPALVTSLVETLKGNAGSI